jgi:microcystin-dependent protein
MTEPITTARYFIVPNTGDLSGAWGTSALNPNFQSIDTLFGGVTTISLSSTTTILLTVPATTGVWPGGNPSQSMNSMIKFTGAQTGSAVIQFTLPGFYIINNQCTGTTFVRLSPSSGGGNSIGAPPGQKVHVFFDGTDMDYVDMGPVGAALDLHTNTTTLPQWMLACSVAPYLVKDGTVYTASVYPALASLLGSTFGGNGVTTFGVPDERARFRLPVDIGGAVGRVTVTGSGITGSILGGSGGDQVLQSHTHTNTLTDPGHLHTIPTYIMQAVNLQFASGGTQGGQGISSATNSTTTGVTITNAAAGTGSSQNMPPCIVSVVALIKT